jgi:prolyl oligopeptidase
MHTHRVHDMLRFYKFTIGGAWVPEYGNPQNGTDFEYIIKYSPLHNIPVLAPPHQLPAVSAPAGCTRLHTRTDAHAHSRSRRPCCAVAHAQVHRNDVLHGRHAHEGVCTRAATQLNAQQQTNPLLARIEVRAGHGGGKPTKKIVSAV